MYSCEQKWYASLNTNMNTVKEKRTYHFLSSWAPSSLTYRINEAEKEGSPSQWNFVTIIFILNKSTSQSCVLGVHR